MFDGKSVSKKPLERPRRVIEMEASEVVDWIYLVEKMA
jgi:hypothetical protein